MHASGLMAAATRFLSNVSQAGADIRDWWLAHRLSSGHRMRIRHFDRRGCIATLPDVPNGGGGSIQGLSISGAMYNPIPIECEGWLRAAVLRAFLFYFELII